MGEQKVYNHLLGQYKAEVEDQGSGVLRQVVKVAELAAGAGEMEVVQDTAADLNCTEANSTAILADTASIDTNTTTIAGAVSGTEMQVDVITMPTVSTTETYDAWGSQTQTLVTVNATSTTVVAANVNRLFVVIRNRGAKNVYLNMAGGTATNNHYLLDGTADGVVIAGAAYTGAITGIVDTGARTVEVWEVDV